MSKGITSVEGFIRKIFSIPSETQHSVFYRGHSNRETYKLQPSLYRKPSHIDNEHLLFRELLIANPTEFSNDASTFEKLVRMQHYSMPTRLFDITSNPLMALYFASKSNNNKTGEVIIFKINNSEVKFFDSDTASCIANLARLSKNDKDTFDLDQDIINFNNSLPAKKLLHYVREEKPFFANNIQPDDINKIICVKGKMTNDRIISQSGAFLLFGLNARLPEAGNSQITIERVTINPNKKSKILQELDRLNINDRTVFPYIENSAKYIANKYG